VNLPPFPVDDGTLDLLWTALHPDPEVSERSSVGDLLRMFEEMAGADPTAVENITESGLHVMRDPAYHPNDVIAALITEVRRLRGVPAPA
jgi:hypothetical protein